MGKAEGYVEKYLKKQIIAEGGLCFKFTSGVNGVPDRIIVINGLTLFVETKSHNGTLSPLQKVQIKRMRDQGADVRVTHTRELVDELITELTGAKTEGDPP